MGGGQEGPGQHMSPKGAPKEQLPLVRSHFQKVPATYPAPDDHPGRAMSSLSCPDHAWRDFLPITACCAWFPTKPLERRLLSVSH